MTDTGIAFRNWRTATMLQVFARLSNLHTKRGLDMGGGHGLLVRILRDWGLNFRWSDEHAINLFARGFEDDGGDYAWLTLIEVFEHLEDPATFLKNAISAHNPQTIVFTTELRPTLVPEKTWPYWTFETGQHISFVTPKTLRYIANELKFRLATQGAFHIMTKEPAQLSRFRFATSRPARALAPIFRYGQPSLLASDHVNLADKVRTAR